MIVAARTFQRQPEKCRRERVHPVRHVFIAEFLGNAAAFIGHAVEPAKSRGQALLARRLIEQIAGKLPGEKFVVREVLVERLDDPVAPRPHVRVAVGLIAERIRVACQVEPFLGHALAEMGGREQAVRNFLKRSRRAVRHEHIHICLPGRQTREIEASAANPVLARSSRRRLQVLLLEPGEHEEVKRSSGPACIGNLRKGNPVGHRHKRPVRLVLRPLGDPLANQFDLVLAQTEI